MWIIVLGQTNGQLVVCDNPNFKELIKAEED
jgi:hypothetical protein